MSGGGGRNRPGGVAAPDVGATLLEVLIAVGICALMAAVAVPQVIGTLDRSRTMAATRYLAARMNLARAQAVARSASVALRFEDTREGVSFSVFVDGNQNGVRTEEIESGVDPLLNPPQQLNELFPGVIVTLPATIRLFSFSSSGTATSGTIGLWGRDGSRFAVRVLGATGRTRALRYDPVSGDFVEGV